MVKITSEDLLTKEDLRQVVETKKQEGDYKYSKKNPAQELRWAISEEEQAKTNAIKYLKLEIKKQKNSLGADTSKMLLAGLEALDYEINKNSQIEFSSLTTASMVNLKKDSVSSSEERYIYALSMDIKKIEERAIKKNKRIENRKIAGQKIGEALERYKADATDLITAVVQGQDPKLVIENLTQQQKPL